MSYLKLYAPAIILIFWAVVYELQGRFWPVVAILTIAVAVWVHIDELRRGQGGPTREA